MDKLTQAQQSAKTAVDKANERYPHIPDDVVNGSYQMERNAAFINGYTKAIEDKDAEMLELIEGLRAYERESRNMIGFDERESEEFLEIFKNRNNGSDQ